MFTLSGHSELAVIALIHILGSVLAPFTDFSEFFGRDIICNNVKSKKLKKIKLYSENKGFCIAFVKFVRWSFARCKICNAQVQNL